MRSPRFADGLECAFLGHLVEPLELHHGFTQCKVIDGQHVCSTERKDQEHLDRPPTDTPNGKQTLDDLLVTHSTRFSPVGHESGFGRSSEIQERKCFVAGDTGSFEPLERDLQEFAWLRIFASENVSHSRVDGSRCFAVELLIENRTQEPVKNRARFGRTQAKRPDGFDQSTDIGITLFQFAQCARRIEVTTDRRRPPSCRICRASGASSRWLRSTACLLSFGHSLPVSRCECA